MIRRHVILSLVAIALSLVADISLIAATPDETLRAGFEQLLEATKQAASASPAALAKSARPILERYIDFGALTRRAFGLGWKDLSPAEQKEAQQLFSELVIRNYASKIKPERTPKASFSTPKKLDGNRQEVLVTVNNDGTDVLVTYRLESSGKSWTVYEILVEGVSLTNSYRSQFDAIRSRSGPKAPLESLRSMIK
jgi:phospholipid transport system substrate-binding protein